MAKQDQMLQSSRVEIDKGFSCRTQIVKTINIERLVPSPLTIERKTSGTHLSLLYSGLLL